MRRSGLHSLLLQREFLILGTMVTLIRTVIRVTASEAAAFAATASTTTSTPSAAADSIISNAPARQQNSTEKESQTNLCNYRSTEPAQQPSPVGLVQLCRHKGCFHVVGFERRGGLCCIHQNQKGPMNGEYNDSEDYDSEEDSDYLTESESYVDSEYESD